MIAPFYLHWGLIRRVGRVRLPDGGYVPRQAQDSPSSEHGQNALDVIVVPRVPELGQIAVGEHIPIDHPLCALVLTIEGPLSVARANRVRRQVRRLGGDQVTPCRYARAPERQVHLRPDLPVEVVPLRDGDLNAAMIAIRQ